LHPVGKLLTAALSEGYGGYKVQSATLAYFDWVNIMAYDAKGGWNQADPGQHSSYQMAADALNYWKGKGVPKSKAILGVPFYGYEFGPSSPRTYAISYKYIAASFPDAVSDDDVASGGGNTIYFNGLSTIIDKTSLAKVSGGGIMIWELSLDATGDVSLLKYIRQVAGSAVTDAQLETAVDKVSFYPNPTTGLITFSGDQTQYAKVELYNTLGEKIRSYSETTSIDISEEPKGVYYLYITKDGNRTINKIILQ
jgi:chitinase